MNKHLRVLTGAHAGASLELTPGCWRVANTEDAAARISDWSDPPLELRIGDDGVRIGAADAGERWQELEPRRFGDIVLCIGPAGQPWPSDLELLQRLLATPAPVAAGADLAVHPAPRAGPRPLTRSLWAGVAALALLTPCALLLASTRDAPRRPATGGATSTAAADPAAQVRDCLERHRIDGARVESQGGQLIVHGFAPTPAQALAAMHALRRISPRIHVDLSTVQDTIENLRESLHEPGLQIAYQGDGRFAISGAASSPDRVRATVEHVKGDLGGNVRDIALDITKARRRDGIAGADSALAVDELHYVESIDGTKDFLAAQR